MNFVIRLLKKIVAQCIPYFMFILYFALDVHLLPICAVKHTTGKQSFIHTSLLHTNIMQNRNSGLCA